MESTQCDHQQHKPVWSIDRQDRPEYFVGLSSKNLELVCLSGRPLGESG